MRDTRDDVASLFRENNDIGSDSSLWLRPLRQLLKEGKPVGQILALTVSPKSQARLPFAMISRTQKDRLIFWPRLPPGTSMIFGGERIEAFDHITLEFPSEKTHVTAYGTDGQPVHIAQAWRTYRHPDHSFALWFLMLVRIPILCNQDMAVQRRVKIPEADKKRRTDEFVSYTRRLSFLNVPLPDHSAEQDYIYFGLFLASNAAMASDNVSAPRLPTTGASVDSQVEGWPDGSTFEITGLRFVFGEQIVCVAAACPPGRLLSDVSIAFPHRETLTQGTRPGGSDG